MKWLGRLAAGGLVLGGLCLIAADIPGLIRGPEGFLDLVGVEALAGLLMAVLGALNLLDERYGDTAVGLRRTAVGATFAAAAICLRMITFGDWDVGAAGVGIMAALLILLIVAAVRAWAGRTRLRPTGDAPTPA